MIEEGRSVRKALSEDDEKNLRARIREIVMTMAPERPGSSVSADNALINDLGFHSLALIELAFALEDEFDLDAIDESSASEIVTVGDIEDYVTARFPAVRSSDAP
jgi:acyl carrier protein